MNLLQGSANHLFLAVHPAKIGGYWAAGKENNPDKLSVMKVEKDGSLEWYFTYKNAGFKVAAIEEVNKALYVVGNSWDFHGITIMKLDFEGNPIWTMGYKSGAGSPEVNSVIAINPEKEDIILAGTFYWDTETRESDIWVMQVNPDGSIGWQYTFHRKDGKESEWGWSIDIGMKEEVLCVAGNKLASDGMSDIWLLELDLSGNFKWQKSFNYLNRNEYAISVMSIKPGNIFSPALVDPLFTIAISHLK